MVVPALEMKKDMSQAERNALLDQARQASDLLKALSHETRLLILCMLIEGEKSVSELEEILGMPQASVSQQLARLRFDRLVSTRREGRQIYYSVARQDIGEVVSLLHSMFCGNRKA